MESIEIYGFLTIDHAHFEIKKINVLIGAQAQGKSVIAKLVYFFKNFFSDDFVESIRKLETKRELNKQCLVQFEQIFPRYTWSSQVFSIVYKNGDYDVSIIRTTVSNKYTLKFHYGKKLANFHKDFIRSYKLELNKFDTQIEQGSSNELQRRENSFLKIKSETDSSFFETFKKPIFIPAGRSFFVNLQKNIFSFLANDIDIDPFIKEFGSLYENSKRIHQAGFRLDKNSAATGKKVDSFVSDIVVGKYVYAEEQDWILNNGKRTNLANASSGQQESLPMLLVLKTWTLAMLSTIFIEEPEAHLFPTSQKQIISLIATIYNAFGQTFFITTHSPYILTAINNLVVGQDAFDKAHGDAEKLARLEKVLPKSELIRLEDVSAYTLNKGKLETIIDLESRLIGTNLLDAVSDEFEAAFGVATDILYGDD